MALPWAILFCPFRAMNQLNNATLPMETNIQRLLHTFAALADLGQEIADTGDFEEMLRASFHLLLGSLAIRRGAVGEYDPEGNQLRLVAARGLGETQDLVLPFSNGHAGQLTSLGS